MGGSKKNWERGRGRGKKNPPACTDCSLRNSVRGRTESLIGAAGCTQTDTCQSMLTLPQTSCPAFKKMADSLTFEAALEESLSFLSELGMSRQLRHEQKEAISMLVHGSDLLAVLPTGFGKSLIFQLLIRVQEILSSKAACVIIVCPLKSIVQDQLIEASSMGL